MLCFSSSGESFGALVAAFDNAGLFCAAAVSCSRATPNPRTNPILSPFLIIQCYARLITSHFVYTNPAKCPAGILQFCHAAVTPICAGKDTFHRVPEMAARKWDALELFPANTVMQIPLAVRAGS